MLTPQPAEAQGHTGVLPEAVMGAHACPCEGGSPRTPLRCLSL
jgi:hypothetical protein